MKKLSIGFYIVITMLSVGCDKKPPNPTKTEVRSIQIAGMPVYEKDYKLTAQNTESVSQP